MNSHAELYIFLDKQFIEDGIVDFHPDEFVPSRVKLPPREIIHRIPIIARICQDLRNITDARVNLTNSYRDPQYNKSIGGSELSQHIEATAGDIVSHVWSPDAVSAWLADHKMAPFLGLGRYNGFTHVDVRGLFPTTPGAIKQPAPARWDNRS